MGVEGLSGMLTHMHVHGCEQAQPAVHPRVLLCRMALLSSALQVEEIEPLVRGKEQRREGEKRSAAVLPIVVMAGTGCVLDASRRVGGGPQWWWWWFVMAVHSSCSIVSSQT